MEIDSQTVAQSKFETISNRQDKRSSPERLSDDPNVHAIGCINFLIGKTKNKMHPVKLLDDFYTQLNRENTTAEGAQTQLTLERIHLIHFLHIFSSSQQSFSLRKSKFKSQKDTAIPFFHINLVWKIQFQSLKVLDISSCKISSVQHLSFMFMPQLKRLELQNNKIYNFRPLSKLHCPNLQYLSCYDNFIILNDLIYRGHFPKLNRIIVDSDRLQADLTRQSHKQITEQTIPHIDFIFKTQNISKMIEMKMNTRKRILPKIFKKVLRQINPEIKLKNKLTNEELMDRLERLGGVGRTNDAQGFRRYLELELQPILREREINPNHVNVINQIRQSLWQRLRQLQAAANEIRLYQETQRQNEQNPEQRETNTMNQQLQNQNFQLMKGQSDPVLTRSSSGSGQKGQNDSKMDIESQDKKQISQVLLDSEKREQKHERRVVSIEKNEKKSQDEVNKRMRVQRIKNSPPQKMEYETRTIIKSNTNKKQLKIATK